MGITTTLAEFAANIRVEDIPDDVRERALALSIDLIGSAVRASHEADSTGPILAALKRVGIAGEGPCTVFGFSRTYPAAAAALLNGAFGHSLDFDDTHADSSLHPSAPVVPAAIAVAELVDASGPALISAIVTGFEICCRLGLALDPTAHYARGFHPTATAGTFGAAAAAGQLLKLNAKQMESAFGIAASQASGSLQFLQNGAWNKRYQVGESSMKGLLAASLAKEDFVGATEAIEGKHGFLNGYTDKPRPEIAVSGLHSKWETMRIGVKPYPACRYTHAAVDGLLSLRPNAGWRAGELEAIRIGLHRNGIALVGDPLEQKRKARSVVEGQFSMPFTAAVAVLRGRFGWDDYDLLGHEEADRIASIVDVRRDEGLEGLRHPFGATLEVTAKGETHSLRIPDPSGEPDTFPSTGERQAKFKLLTEPVLNGPADDFLACLTQLGTTPSVRSTLRGAGVGRLGAAK